MDQLTVLGNAHIPDFSILREHTADVVDKQGVRTRTPIAGQPPVHDDDRLLHSDACLPREVVCGTDWRHCLRVLHIFHNPHWRRAYMEIRDACLYTAHNSRHGVVLPWKISVGRSGDGAFRHDADCIQPRTDDLLLDVPDGIYSLRLSPKATCRAQGGTMA